MNTIITMTSVVTQDRDVAQGRVLFSLSLFSSLWGRQLLNCLALRPPIGPNALPLINQKPNDKGEGLYPP